MLVDLSHNNIIDEKRNWVYRDITFPPKFNKQTKSLEYLTDLQSVKNGMRLILDWKLGERILYPDFGNILYNYVGEIINELTLRNIKQDIYNMFAEDIRIKILDVNVSVNPEDNHQIDILIKYNIVLLNIIDNLNYYIKLNQ